MFLAVLCAAWILEYSRLHYFIYTAGAVALAVNAGVIVERLVSRIRR
jgi:hypothetical protein